MQREFVYDLLSHRQKYQGYRRYVEAGLDEKIKDFYDRGRTGTVIGDENFVTWVREKKWQKLDDKGFVAQVLPGRLTMDALIPLVAAYYKLDTKRLTQVVKGPKKGLLARKVAMYLCQQLGGASPDGYYAYIWFVECRLGQFYHDPDSATYQ